MEDQSTDTSGLTKAGSQDGAAATSAPTVTPVGKRGRHRTFRPRAVSTTQAATPDAPEAAAADAAADATVETTAVELEPAAVEPESTAVDETVEAAPAEAAPKAKRRGWFRRPSASTVVAEPAAPAEEAASESDITEPTKGEAAGKKRKPAGKLLTAAVATAAVLFVGAGAFGGAMLQPYLADEVAADTKLDIARTAADAITTLFTYTPDDIEQLPARTAKYLGSDLKDDYAKQVDALAAANKQNQVRRNAQVVGAAVKSLNGADASAIVYANVSYTSAASPDVPTEWLLSYQLTMQREGSDWVITNMPWITSKQLTRISP